MSILGGIPHDSLWAALTESLADEESSVVTLSLHGGGSAVVRCEAVRDEGRLVGAVGDVRLRVPGVPRQGRVPEVPEYVGWSAAVRNAAVALRASATEHLAACVSGEPGTGKRTMARVVVGRAFPGRNLLVLDAAEATPERVGDELARGHPVLVPLVESLSLEALTELVVTATSTGRSGWVVMTHQIEAGERPARWPPGLRVVTLPPLRTRPEDIELVLPLMLQRRARGRELVLTPELVERLRREPWPTNLHGIDLLVTELARTTTGRVIGVPDLPAEFDAMMRRRLTPMEWLTRHAILEALEASNGNKSRAAESLGISRASIYRKIKALGIELNGQSDEGAEG